MTSSLVGSEMCIRDRSVGAPGLSEPLGARACAGSNCLSRVTGVVTTHPVSYTHLTLPTICSV
eukprot:2631759-Prorocentrum_lima.AAC.1